MTCRLPDPFHVKQDDAAQVAAECVTAIASHGRIALYVDPVGVVQLVINRELTDLDLCGFSLVGVYDADASAADIAADILAMERERIHGRAEG